MKKIAIALSLFLIAGQLFAQSTLAKNEINPYPKTISVTGSASLEIVPDEIYVQVTLSEYDKKGTGKIQLENIKTNFLAACAAAGIPDSNISVAGYEGYDRWYWKKRKKAPDMNATISYEILFKTTAQMDALVDKLDDEATQAFSIVRTSHSNITAFRKQLKIQAVKAAKDKAEYLSEAVGEKVGTAINITEPSEGSDIINVNYLAQSNSMENVFNQSRSTASANTAYKKMKLRYEVTVVFALQ